jgi:chromate reductase
MLNISAFSGSLQKSFCNTDILRALFGHNHKILNIEILNIHEIPLFSEDIERLRVPEAVKKIAEKVRAVNCLIFVMPENNPSVSAPIKNTYD